MQVVTDRERPHKHLTQWPLAFLLLPAEELKLGPPQWSQFLTHILLILGVTTYLHLFLISTSSFLNLRIAFTSSPAPVCYTIIVKTIIFWPPTCIRYHFVSHYILPSTLGSITLSIPSTCHSVFTPANVPSISYSSNFSHSHGSTHKCDFTKVTAFKKQPSFGSYAPLVITYFFPPISRIISLKK